MKEGKVYQSYLDVFKEYTLEEVEEMGSLVLVTELNQRRGVIKRLEIYIRMVRGCVEVLEEGLKELGGDISQ